MTLAGHRLVVVQDEPALAQAVADEFVAAASVAISARGHFDVALAGGSTPKAAYALLAVPPRRERIAWTRARFFFGDERCVPPDDDQSNYKMAHDAFLAPLGISERQVFRIHGEDEPAAAARAYAEVMRLELGATPVFDLIMLGMGPDGHTASLFPGSDPLSDDEALVRAVWVEKFETFRITVTPKVINAARHVVIAAGGAAKADALHAVFDGARNPTAHPIQIVAPTAGSLTWFVDQAAASELTPLSS